MARAAHIDVIDGKAPRQRVWEAIRGLREQEHFTQADIARVSRASKNIVRDYVKCLLHGGYIAVVAEIVINALCVERGYCLVRDNGQEAPRLTKTGKAVTQGAVNAAMWGTLRRMGKAEAMDYRQLAAFASTVHHRISEETAKTYVLALAAAGYLRCVQPAVRGSKPAPGKYRLYPAMDSGYRAPMIQRTKCVFDPNWNRLVRNIENGVFVNKCG